MEFSSEARRSTLFPNGSGKLLALASAHTRADKAAHSLLAFFPHMHLFSLCPLLLLLLFFFFLLFFSGFLSASHGTFRA